MIEHKTDAVQQTINAVERVRAAIAGGSVVAMGEALSEAMQDLHDAVTELRGADLKWDMPRRKRETLQRRHDYLRSISHDQRNQFMEAEIAALDWVLHRVNA